MGRMRLLQSSDVSVGGKLNGTHTNGKIVLVK